MKFTFEPLFALCVLGASSLSGCGDPAPSYAGNTVVRVEWPFPVHPFHVENGACCGESVDGCLDDLLFGDQFSSGTIDLDPDLFPPTEVTEVVMDLPTDMQCAAAFYVECAGEILCTASQTFEVPSQGQRQVNIVSVCGQVSDAQKAACLDAG
jgi:hypothetical protein